MNCEYISKLTRGCAFVPCYVKNIGKVTKIYYIDGGNENLPYSMNKVLNDYFAIYEIDLKEIKSNSQRATGRKNIVPLYIKEKGVFLPVKTIKPCTRGDSCIGYVNTKYIEDINFAISSIKLNNGVELKYLDGDETIKKRMGDCSIISKKNVGKEDTSNFFLLTGKPVSKSYISNLNIKDSYKAY